MSALIFFTSISKTVASARRSCQSAIKSAPWRGIAALALTAALSACASLPSAPPSPPSYSLNANPAGELARIAKASTPSDEESGFRLLPLGAYSLDARLQLVRRAQSSLDLQYYVLENDPTGRLLLRELRDAAARGVRVRLLLDDLYTTHTSELLRALAAFPNVQVRLFNPFCCSRDSGIVSRFAASLFDVRRLNHRMHNKLFIADGVMAVAGGRNIADEYFMRSADRNFVDVDAFAMGAVVQDLRKIFDTYWNSDVVYPIESIERSTRSAADLQQAFDADMAAKAVSAPPELPPVDVIGYGPLADDFATGRIGLVWGKAYAYADPPDKRNKTTEQARQSSVTFNALMSLWTAKEEMVITSPYMIPGKLGMQSFTALRGANVKVTVLTNSLAATDEPLVHTGYSRYRTDMLTLGVEMYELSPSRTQRVKRLGFGTSLGRLHSKTAVVDGQRLFIGSMNLDPRSESQNTELGLFIDSPELARELLRVIQISAQQGAYRLRLQPNGSTIEWVTADGDNQTVTDVEPESTTLLRLQNAFFGFFVPEHLL